MKLLARVSIVCGVLCAALLSGPASAAVVYDNSVNDLLTRLNPGTQEVGDEIILAGTDRTATKFEFEYWGEPVVGGFTGRVDARVRFYINDGALFQGVFSPGTVFYDSGLFGIAATNRATLAITDFVTGATTPLAQNLPNRFTWSIQFSGLFPGDTAGVDIFSPPVVGNSFTDYWVNNAGSWALQTNIVSMDFAARLEAVPEPSVWALLGGGLVATLLVARRRR
jgi:hypothetical protein